MLTTTDMPILAVDSITPQRESLDQAAAVLASGRLVVAPTETRYALMVRADSEEALKRLYDVKGRGKVQPTSIFVPSRDEMANLGQVTKSADVLSRRFLPGPLTLVLQSPKLWGAPVVVDGKIGLRYSSSPVISGLLKGLDFPVTATSANVSGSPDLSKVAEIEAVFGDQVSLYLDGGELHNATSTVVDCSGPEVLILRQGAISAEAIGEELRNAGVQ